jgi:hypothetical protein
VSQSSLVNSTGNFVAVVPRRSTRIEKSVPLIVLGKNRMGEPFMERTVSVTVNNHGCLYPSRHDHGVGTWVTLQLVGLIGDDEKPQTVRAMVRSIHPPASFRELQQVGVELETPANVWGIEPAPVDWTSTVEAIVSTPQLAAVVAPAPEPETKRAALSEVPLKPDPEAKRGEVTSISSRSPATSRPTAPDGPEAPRPQRVVVTADGLISALQGRFQQEAEKAVQAALEKQVNDRIPARLNEAVCQATSDFESAIAVVLDRRYELLLEGAQIATQEALAKLNARSAEVQALAQSALNSSVEEFQRETERHVTMALAETKKRAVSALSSLDAESRAACDARREALEAEVSRSAERAAEEFRKGMKELLYSCLGAAVGAEKFAGGTEH